MLLSLFAIQETVVDAGHQIAPGSPEVEAGHAAAVGDQHADPVYKTDALIAEDEALIVDVPGYDGPLDLLLTLARTQKVDLMQVSVLALAEQYLAFIEEARSLRIELAADYLVMAAWLAYLKSRLLLPPEPETGGPSAEDLAAHLAFQLERLNAMREAAARVPFHHLIYPVPEPGGLGVHLTLDMAGQARFGPDVEWIDTVDYRVNPTRRAHFEAEIRRYWPGLPADALAPTYCGIRPKISGPGEPAADFRLDGPDRHGVPGLVNLYGIESPGLTSSLAIGEAVADALMETQ